LWESLFTRGRRKEWQAMTSENKDSPALEGVERRLAGVEHTSRILILLVLMSLSASFIALVLALVTLLTTD